jgi:hypothetical protein
MSLTVINGLPAHVLFVHLVVIFVPLTALALVICAISPKIARRLGFLLPLLGFVTLASVPLTTHAGEWLARHVDSDPYVRRHAELGDSLLPWAMGLFLLCVAAWWIARRSVVSDDRASAGRRTSTLLRAAAAVLSLVVAGGAVVDVYRIGDSGAKAAWHDNFSQSATSHSSDS